MPYELLKGLLKQSPEKYWARPKPPADGGDESACEIYIAVGHALSRWESLESSLADLFIMFSEPNTVAAIRVARRAYGAIGFNSGRRQAVSFVGELYFGRHWRTSKKHLNRLLSHIDNASQRRDDIAHGLVVDFISSRNSEKPDTFSGFRLVPPRYNARMNFGSAEAIREFDPISLFRGRYQYTRSSIDDFSQKFVMLSDSLYEYMDIIPKADGEFSAGVLAQFENPL